MNKFITKFLILFFILTNNTNAEANIMILRLKDGDVKIELFEDVAPNHVKRIKQLAEDGKYDGVVFHRVIDGFMAQTGDVQFGNSSNDNFELRRAGRVILIYLILRKSLAIYHMNEERYLWLEHRMPIVQIVSFLSVLKNHLFLIDNTQCLEKLLRVWNL